ncbi:MAG: sulfatase-like hydrolase/transferase [Planctomycetota bacterium]
MFVILERFLAVGILTVACCFAQAANAAAAAAKKTADPTNVVLILIDDLSHFGVTAYGANRIRSLQGSFPDQEFSTPNIDRLAREGLRCDYAYAYPLCENTRVAIMSGMGNDRNYLKPKSLHASDITFGDTFRRAGYATGLFGKWKQSRGTRSVPGKDYVSEFGWQDYVAFDVVTEGQRFINPNLVINGQIVNYTGRADLDPVTGRRWYGPDLVNRRALDFLERHRDRPFFLYYPMHLVHDEHKPTPDTRPHSVFDEFDEANHNREGHTGDDLKYFPDMIAYMDKLIGNVVSKLDDLGLRERTLIVVVGDNGTKETFAHILPNGQVYPARKGGNADNGIHVPLILSQPGVIPTGSDGKMRSYDGMVDITDIYPTIAEATGIEIPNADHLDGISFWPQAKGGPGEPRQTIYRWYVGNNIYKDEHHTVRFAFDREFKRYAPSSNFPAGRFFDLRTDLLERVGSKKVELKWKVMRYSGLELDMLTDEQRAAYDRLGTVLAKNTPTPVNKLTVAANQNSMKIGERQQLTYRVFPANARRRGVIWESSDPAVAKVDKFGVVTALKPGDVQITIYSWDDAEPYADNGEIEYRRDGFQAQVSLRVQ